MRVRITLATLSAVQLMGASFLLACPPAPLPVRHIDLPRFYADAGGTQVNAAASHAHKLAVAPLTAFLRHVTAQADKALTRASAPDRRKAAQCALSWLNAWAEGGAWLGTMATKQADYQRKWDLAGTALAYVKVKAFASPAERSVIEPWLIAIADQARVFFNDPTRARNNHWYWLGLALAATALAADSPRHWDEARTIASDAARAIAADGTLPMELARGSRSLHYHAFALMPLITMAELAAARGEDWYGLSSGALHRLVAVTHDGLLSPERFDRQAGTLQERPVNAHAGWLAPYLQRFPDRLAAPHPFVARTHRWLGGDPALVVKILESRRPTQ